MLPSFVRLVFYPVALPDSTIPLEIEKNRLFFKKISMYSVSVVSLCGMSALYGPNDTTGVTDTVSAKGVGEIPPLFFVWVSPKTGI